VRSHNTRGASPRPARTHAPNAHSVRTSNAVTRVTARARDPDPERGRGRDGPASLRILCTARALPCGVPTRFVRGRQGGCARARDVCVCRSQWRCTPMYVCMACAFLNPDARASRDTRAMVFASRDGSCGRHSTMSRRAAFGVGVRDVRAKICTLVHACVNVWVCVGDVLMRAGIRRRAGTSTAIRATRTRAPRRRLRRLSVCVVFV
jgi:hypothetical protein